MSKKKNTIKMIRKLSIIILIVAAIGAAGFFGWQYFSQLKTDNSSNNTSGARTEDVKVDLSKIIYDTTNGSNLAIKYPENWKTTNEGSFAWALKHYKELVLEPGTTIPANPDAWTITSPDDKVSVIFDINSRDPDEVCDATDTNLQIGKINTYSITNYEGYVFAIDVNYNVSGDNYYYDMAVFKSGDWVTGAKIGDQHCVTGVQGIRFTTTEGDNVVATLEVKFNDIEEGKGSTLDDINTALQSDNFSIAKQIVRSLHIKSN